MISPKKVFGNVTLLENRWVDTISFALSNDKAVPSRKIWRRPLMVRQPYSVAVPSTGGRLHPLVPEEREAW